MNNQSALAKDGHPGFWLKHLPILFILQLISIKPNVTNVATGFDHETQNKRNNRTHFYPFIYLHTIFNIFTGILSVMTSVHTSDLRFIAAEQKGDLKILETIF